MASSLELHVRNIVTSRIYPCYGDVCAQVIEAWRSFKDLTPRLDKFTVPGARAPQQLVTMDGTIPVTYKTSTYNIPVQIWLPEQYPNIPPLCFVRPTPDMRIKTSRYVDDEGRVFLPYLHEWRFPTSDLVGLISVMVIVFGDEPPVFAKPRSRTSGGSSSEKNATSTQPKSAIANQQSGANQSSMPSYPQVHSNSPSASWGGTAATAYPSINSATPGFVHNNNHQPPPIPPPPTNYSTNTITEEHIHASLVSAVEERIKRKLNERISQAEAELDSLRRTKHELQQGSQRLDHHIEQLDREKLKVDEHIIQISEKIAELNRAVEQMQSKADQKNSSTSTRDAADDAISPVAPVYQQIMQEYAEMCALEDAVYFLGEALRKKTIDVETFLEKVRELSRRQFKSQALVQKCRERAGLPV